MTNALNHSDADNDNAVVSRYSRADAIADGMLIDVSDTARELGFTIPVALTAAVWSKCIVVTASTAEIERYEQGHLWDLLWMLHIAIRRASADRSLDRKRFAIACVRASDGKRIRVPLYAVCGPDDVLAPVITVMLPSED